MALPIYMNYEDLTTIVDYLKTKATGVTIEEAKKVISPKLLDGRKLSALVSWGYISRDGEKINLTPEGREFVRLNPEGRSRHLWKAVRRVKPYRTIIEWMFHSKTVQVTNVDVAARWHDFKEDGVGTENENTLKDSAVCFFYLADAAGLGIMTIGRHGKATRFDANMATLGLFIGEEDPSYEAEEVESEPEEKEPATLVKPMGVATLLPQTTKSKQIFIAHGKNREPLERIKAVLDQFMIPYKIAVDEPNGGRPISKKVADIMMDCTSAVFVFTCDEETVDSKGNKIWKPSDNVVYELGAASVLYDGKIVIFKEEGVEFASDFKELGYISFEKGKIDSKTLDLIKELIGFGLVKVSAA